jgi:hypothetical protein
MRPRTTPSLLPALGLLVLAVPATAQQLTPIGLSEVGAQWFVNDDPTSPDPDADEYFAAALAVGDFDGDGFDDLATGVPEDDGPSAVAGSGSVAVRYGAPSGLETGTVSIVLREDPGSAFPDENFGAALAVGDFDGDGFGDLAVGIPFDRPDGVTSRGGVRIYFGTSGGLQSTGSQLLGEADDGEPQHLCEYAEFGYALAAGNFDGDAYADLAVGVRSGCENTGTAMIQGGSVVVAHGTATGLLPFYGYRISQDSFGLYEQVEPSDSFGSAVAAGDFNGDGYDDLSIGVPGEEGTAGAVQTLMGSQFGLIFANSVFWYPGALGEVPEAGDHLGLCLIAGDLDGDGHDDLAIGTAFEDVDSFPNAGAIDVAYGAPDPFWFDLSRTDRIDQSTIYGPGHQGHDHLFGYSLAAGDFDGDGHDDLAVGHPGDSATGSFQGNVTILMGASPGIGASTRFRLLALGREGLPGEAGQPEQGMGSALAAGDLDGNGLADLAIGVPNYNNLFETDLGAEMVLYGALFADGFEIGSAARWSTVGP